MNNVKTFEQYFSDWESEVFGYGYGTGESHVLSALKEFFGLLHFSAKFGNPSYKYEELEENLSAPTTWLLINALCHANIIEYGVSPRYGWLSEQGKNLYDFCVNKSINELYRLTDTSNFDEYYAHCGTRCCNCEHSECENPFFIKIKGRNHWRNK